MEAGVFPFIPCDDGMIRRCESFLFANGGDPLIDRLFVGELEAIQLRTFYRHSAMISPKPFQIDVVTLEKDDTGHETPV